MKRKLAAPAAIIAAAAPGSQVAQGDEHYANDYMLLLVIGVILIVGLAFAGALFY